MTTAPRGKGTSGWISDLTSEFKKHPRAATKVLRPLDPDEGLHGITVRSNRQLAVKLGCGMPVELSGTSSRASKAAMRSSIEPISSSRSACPTAAMSALHRSGDSSSTKASRAARSKRVRT